MSDIGYFGLCNKNNKLQESETRDWAECCHSFCFHPKNCEKLCHDKFAGLIDRDNCINSCYEQRVSCMDACGTGTEISIKDNPFLECVTLNKCRVGDTVSLECLEKNRNEIIPCCVNRCNTQTNLNCVDHCKYAYESMLKYIEYDSKQRISRDVIKTEGLKKSSDKVLYIFLFIVLVSFFLIFFIDKKK